MNMDKSLPFWKIAIVVILSLLVTGVAVAIVAAGGSDFVYGELRVDQPEIYNARGYRTLVAAWGAPNSTIDYTAAWLGLNLAQQTTVTFSGKFSQVGLLTKLDNIRWFVYAEPGVTCLRGSPAWGIYGCEGSPGDLVSLQTWYRVELFTEGNGYWIARLYDTYGNPYDLARIWYISNRIYRAGVVSEEAYSSAQDPYLTANFYHYRPQYSTTNGYQDWPVSNGNNSFIWAGDNYRQNTFCPDHYGTDPNFENDERAWYAGTSGKQCWWLLFPAAHVRLPLIRKDPTPTPTVCVGC